MSRVGWGPSCSYGKGQDSQNHKSGGPVSGQGLEGHSHPCEPLASPPAVVANELIGAHAPKPSTVCKCCKNSLRNIKDTL